MSMNTPSLRGAVDLSSLTRPAPSTAPSDVAAAGGLSIEGTETNFGSILELSRQVPVVVLLWASWSEPSQQLRPMLERVVAEYAGRIVLARVDADANPQLAQAFGAQGVPTVAALLAGQPVPMFAGAIAEAQLREVFEQLLQVAAQNGITGQVPVDPDASDPATVAEPAAAPLPPHHQAAYDAIEAGDYATAIAEYQAALAEQPRDAEAAAGLAQVKLLSRLQGKTLDEIRNAAAARPDDVHAQLDVADLDLSGGHIADAFDRLLGVFPTASPAEKTLIRERLVELFEVVGATDPVVIDARKRLSLLLY